jgi:gamma-glutamyltranspeptidase / glutathione hydrolase
MADEEHAGAGWQRARMRRGAVAAGNADAAAAAGEILEQGGNAVDAALAAGFAMGVVEPLDSGLGAGGFMTIHDAASGTTDCIDFMGAAPLAAHYEIYAASPPGGSYHIRVKGRANELGHTSVAVPGCLAGFSAAHERFGRLPFAALMAPAIRLADDGFVVARKAALRMERTEELLNLTAETRRVLKRPDGTLFRPGDRMSNPDYGRSLRQIAKGGAAAFYDGPLGQAILADMKAHDGFLDEHDLRNYRAIWRRPAAGRFRDLDIRTMPPPSSGALVVAGLNALAAEVARGGEDLDRHEALARAMLAMFRRRAAALGDPAYLRVDTDALIGAGESNETTSLCAVDADGNAACITYSNNNHSGVVVPGTGILLNNQMLLFSPWPDNPNQVVGGKRPASSMMPTLALRDGRITMAIGASGSTRIISAILQVLYHAFVRGLDLHAAITEPRLHAETESMRADEDIAPAARAVADRLGLEFESSPGRDPSMASVQAIRVDGEVATAVGDPRAGAAGRVF